MSPPPGHAGLASVARMFRPSRRRGCAPFVVLRLFAITLWPSGSRGVTRKWTCRWNPSALPGEYPERQPDQSVRGTRTPDDAPAWVSCRRRRGSAPPRSSCCLAARGVATEQPTRNDRDDAE